MTFECNFHIVIHVTGLEIISRIDFRSVLSFSRMVDILLQYVAWMQADDQIKLRTVIARLFLTMFESCGKMCHLQDVRAGKILILCTEIANEKWICAEVQRMCLRFACSILRLPNVHSKMFERV